MNQPAPDWHVFSGHDLAPSGLEVAYRLPFTEIWPSLLLVFCLLLLLTVRVSAQAGFGRMVQSVFAGSTKASLLREETAPRQLHAPALQLLFLICITFVLYRYNSMAHLVLPLQPNLHRFLFFFTAVLILFAYRVALTRFIGFITDARRLTSDYLSGTMSVNQVFAVFLFPCVVLLQFSELLPQFFFWMGVGVVALALLVRWYRGLMLAIGAENVGLLQIFTYFCALEILPVLVMVKYLIETF